jgi:hypothetical protein
MPRISVEAPPELVPAPALATAPAMGTDEFAGPRTS